MKLTKLVYDPFFFFIEPTNACDIRCRHCPQSAGSKRTTGFMDMDLFKTCIRQIQRFRPMLVTLHLAGEPLLHKRLPEMIRIARDANIDVTCASNCNLMTPEKAERVIQSGLDSIRFDFSLDQTDFETIRTGSDWNNVLNNILTFIRIRKSLGRRTPMIMIRYLDFGKDNSQTVEKNIQQLIWRYPEFQEVAFEPYALHSWSGRFAREKQHQGPFQFSMVGGNYYPCSHVWSSLSICWDGTVVPCCRDFNADYPLGNLNTSTLKKIWNGDSIRSLRELQKRQAFQKIPLCHACSKLWEGKKPINLLLSHFLVKRPIIRNRIGQ
jgi:radical SAM protein with 4Fe4S-binding SPASM domain